MKKIAYILAVIANFAAMGYADAPADGAVTFGTDSKALTVSSTTVSPTQILSRDPYVLRTWIINTSTNTLIVSTFSHTMNPATDVNIPGSTIFSPDGPQVPYWGPMFAVLNGTSSATNGSNISILRTK